MDNPRIYGVSIVYHVEESCAVGVGVPECYGFSVGTPPETITTSEFLFIDPIKRAVDDFVVPVMGQLDYLSCICVLHVEVVAGNIRYSAPIR